MSKIIREFLEQNKNKSYLKSIQTIFAKNDLYLREILNIILNNKDLSYIRESLRGIRLIQAILLNQKELDIRIGKLEEEISLIEVLSNG